MNVPGSVAALADATPTKETPAIDSSNEEFETRMTALAGNYERYAVSQYISKLASDELVRAGLATAPN